MSLVVHLGCMCKEKEQAQQEERETERDRERERERERGVEGVLGEDYYKVVVSLTSTGPFQAKLIFFLSSFFN